MGSERQPGLVEVSGEEFDRRLEKLTHDGMPRPNAVRVARLEALGLDPRDAVRRRAAANGASRLFKDEPLGPGFPPAEWSK